MHTIFTRKSKLAVLAMFLLTLALMSLPGPGQADPEPRLLKQALSNNVTGKLMNSLVRNDEYDPDNPIQKLECFFDKFIAELNNLEQCEGESICIASGVTNMILGFLNCIEGYEFDGDLNNDSDEDEDDLDSLEPLEFIYSYPEAGEEEVPVDTEILVEFNNPIDITTVSAAGISLKNGLSRVAVGFDFDYEETVIIITPERELAYGSEYTLSIKGASLGLSDIAGSALESTLNIHFTTEQGDQAEALQIVSMLPEDGETDIDVDLEIEVEFNNPVDSDTVNNSTYYVRRGIAGAKVAGSYYFDYDDTVVYFLPDSELDEGGSYSVTVENVKDIYGSTLGRRSKIKFTTVEPEE